MSRSDEGPYLLGGDSAPLHSPKQGSKGLADAPSTPINEHKLSSDRQTPLSAQRVTMSTPGSVAQKTLHELDDLIHQRKMELSALKTQNKLKYESGIQRPRVTSKYAESSSYIRSASIQSSNRVLLPTTVSALSTATSARVNGQHSSPEGSRDPTSTGLGDSPSAASSNAPLSNSSSSFTDARHLNSDHVTIPKSLFEELQSTQSKLATLQTEFELKRSQLESAVSESADQNAELNRLVKQLSQDKHKLASQKQLLEDDLQSTKQDLQSALDLLKEKSALVEAAQKQDNSVLSDIEKMRTEVEILGGIANMCGIAYSPVAEIAASDDGSQHVEMVFALQDKATEIRDKLSEFISAKFSVEVEAQVPAESVKFSTTNGEKIETSVDEQIANFRRELTEAELRFNAAAQSAFEWEAHSAALSNHFESQIADMHAQHEELLGKLAAQAEQLAVAEALVSAGSSIATETAPQTVSTASIVPEDTSSLVTKETTISKYSPEMLADRKRLVIIAKTWMNACDKSWEQGDMRRLFDALKMNVRFEAMKRLYQNKTKEYIKQERIRIREELLKGGDGNPKPVMPPSPSDSADFEGFRFGASGDEKDGTTCRLCKRAFGTGSTTDPSASVDGSSTVTVEQQPKLFAVDLALLNESLQGWTKAYLGLKRRPDNSGYLLMMALFQSVLWLLILIVGRQYIKYLFAGDSTDLSYGRHRVTS